MGTQFWIIGQITIDVVILILLLVILKFHLRRRGRLEGFNESAKESEMLLQEMKEISSAFENNLEQKKKLSLELLAKLDERLNEAEKISQRLKSAFLKYGVAAAEQKKPKKQVDPSKNRIEALMDKGYSKEDISRRLGIPVEELELILKLQCSSEALRS